MATSSPGASDATEFGRIAAAIVVHGDSGIVVRRISSTLRRTGPTEAVPVLPTRSWAERSEPMSKNDGVNETMPNSFGGSSPPGLVELPLQPRSALATMPAMMETVELALWLCSGFYHQALAHERPAQRRLGRARTREEYTVASLGLHRICANRLPSTRGCSTSSLSWWGVPKDHLGSR